LTLRFAPEAFGAVAPIVGLACVALAWGLWSGNRIPFGLAVCFGIASIAILLFFRDPQRRVPTDTHAIVSPADGTVLTAETLVDGRKHVAIFMSVFSVHVNRTPVAGVVRSVKKTPGTYFHAGSPEAERGNARVEIEADSRFGPVSWRQMSGLIARKISCRLKVGQEIASGERFGLIYFGSRMDVFMPASASLQTEPGCHVYAGESVIARFSTEEK
jgi:phosphatidylserine decarboxylase